MAVKNEKQYEALKKKGMSEAAGRPDRQLSGRVEARGEKSGTAELHAGWYHRAAQGRRRRAVRRPPRRTSPVTVRLHLSGEEHAPRRSSCPGGRANGFDFVTVSDHFHPWKRRRATAPSCGRARRDRARHRAIDRLGVSCPTVGSIPRSSHRPPPRPRALRRALLPRRGHRRSPERTRPR